MVAEINERQHAALANGILPLRMQTLGDVNLKDSTSFSRCSLCTQSPTHPLTLRQLSVLVKKTSIKMATPLTQHLMSHKFFGEGRQIQTSKVPAAHLVAGRSELQSPAAHQAVRPGEGLQTYAGLFRWRPAEQEGVQARQPRALCQHRCH